MTDSREFCWRSGKRMYASKAEAARGSRGLRDTYPYRCESCGRFHFARRRRPVEKVARRREGIVE